MTAPFAIAVSGLQALGTRLRANADNIANFQSEGFKRTRVLFSDREPYGVKAAAEKIDIPGTTMYEQHAHGQEAVELSNVDLGRELPDMNLNTIMYKANLRTIEAADEMLASLLKIKA